MTAPHGLDPFPFRAVLTDRPYPPTGLGKGGWLTVPAEMVTFADLILTQAHANIPALWGITSRTAVNDLYPHVVAHGGQLYLEDGHNRVVRRALTEDTTAMYMRVYRRSPA